MFEAQGYSPEMLSVYVLARLDVVCAGSTDQLISGLETVRWHVLEILTSQGPRKSMS